MSSLLRSKDQDHALPFTPSAEPTKSTATTATTTTTTDTTGTTDTTDATDTTDTKPINLGPSKMIQTPLKKIPRMDWRDKSALEVAKLGQPIVFTNTNLVDNIINRWDLNYINMSVSNTATFSIYETDEENFFMYDKFSSDGERENPRAYSFEPKVTRRKGTFDEFCNILGTKLIKKEDKLKRTEEKDDDDDDDDANENGGKKESVQSDTNNNTRTKRVYLQQALYDGIGEAIKEDFTKFHWVSIVLRKTGEKIPNQKNSHHSSFFLLPWF